MSDKKQGQPSEQPQPQAQPQPEPKPEQTVQPEKLTFDANDRGALEFAENIENIDEFNQKSP
jgi:hypothetical protein